MRDNLDDFFNIVSKLVIFLPVGIIILALISRFNQTPKISQLDQHSLSPTMEITPTLLPKININLTGPYHCLYKKETTSVEVYIKNKNVLATVSEKNKTNRYLLKGDCLYINSNITNKTCGMTKYLNMAETVLKTGFLDPSTVLKQYLGKDLDFNEIIKSCKKETFDEAVFE